MVSEDVHTNLKTLSHNMLQYCDNNSIIYDIVNDQPLIQGFVFSVSDTNKDLEFKKLTDYAKKLCLEYGAHLEIDNDHREGPLFTFSVAAINDGYWKLLNYKTMSDKNTSKFSPLPNYDAERVRHGQTMYQKTYKPLKQKIEERWIAEMIQPVVEPPADYSANATNDFSPGEDTRKRGLLTTRKNAADLAQMPVNVLNYKSHGFNTSIEPHMQQLGKSLDPLRKAATDPQSHTSEPIPTAAPLIDIPEPPPKQVVGTDQVQPFNMPEISPTKVIPADAVSVEGDDFSNSMSKPENLNVSGPSGIRTSAGTTLTGPNRVSNVGVSGGGAFMPPEGITIAGLNGNVPPLPSQPSKLKSKMNKIGK